MHRALGRVPALFAVLAVLCAGPTRAEPERSSPVRTAVPSAEAPEPLWIEAPPASGRIEPDLAPLVRQLEKSIVRLSAAGLADPSRRSQATAFVISARGYLVTSDALLANARDLRASFQGGPEIPVELVGRDPNTEIALLRVDPARLAAEGLALVPVHLGDSGSLRGGDEVLTLGHGDADGSSAAQGIVAGRDLRIGPLGASGARYLRLDMLLVPGFGGAPLVDLRGRVVGIISGERLTGSELDSISFAVPIEAAKSVLPDLARRKLAPAGWLGVQVQTLSEKVAAGLGLPGNGGALVARVLKDSPAERAQLEQGDVILELDGQPIRASGDLSAQVGRTRPGSEVSVLVLRRGARKKLRAVIEPRLEPVGDGGSRERQGSPGWGFQCAELDRELALRLSLPETTRGIVVARIDAGGAAQQAELQIGDAVLAVDGQRIGSLEALETALRASDAPVLMIERAERARFVELGR
jgi:serine protease Do